MDSHKPIGDYTLQKVELRPYDPVAVLVADEIAGLINDRLPYVVVEHIGSTAVPGLAGKGIVDLMLVYPAGHLDTVKSLLQELGFQPQPHTDPFPEDRPMRVGSYRYMGSTYQIHIHVIHEESPEVVELRAFRDRLRYDKVLQTAYMDFKKALLKAGITESKDYAREKGKFVEKNLTAR
mgnify:CR=1 FL=1